MQSHLLREPSKISSILSTRFSHVSYDADLRDYNTLKVGGTAHALAEPVCIEELIDIYTFALNRSIPTFILGLGSNVIPDDRGFKGLIISTRNLDSKPELVSPQMIRVSSGYYLPRLVIFCQKLGLSGLEWAIGIPGSIGGAIWMNAGASGSVISSVLRHVVIWDGKKEVTLAKDDLKWGHRYSQFQENRNWLILEAYFQLEQLSEMVVKQKVNERLHTIRQTQPRSYRSVGTVFIKGRNSFLTGLCVGGMKCSEKNPAWILNMEDGTANDAYKLIKRAYWRHVWHGELPLIEPRFIPYDIENEKSHTEFFNNPPSYIRYLAKIISSVKYLRKKIS